MGCVGSKGGDKRGAKYKSDEQERPSASDGRGKKNQANEFTSLGPALGTSVDPAATVLEPIKAATDVTSSGSNIVGYKPKRPKLDPKDFKFENLKGETKVKPPG